MKNTATQNAEIFCLCLSLTAFRIFTSLPLIFSFTSGTGAPLSALLSGIGAIVLILLCYQGRSIMDSIKSPFAKYSLSVLALIYLAASACFTLTEFSQFAKATAFPATPLWFVSLFFVTAAGIGALKGTSPCLKLCRFFIPVFVAVIFILVLSVLWKSDLTNLFPLLGNQITDTLGKGLCGILFYSDLPLILLIDQPSNAPKKMRRFALWGTIFGVLVCTFTVIAHTAKIPYPLSKDGQFPFYLLMKEVSFGRFFQRVDSIVLFISVLWGMFSLCLNLSLMAKILCETFEITSKPAIIFPLSAVLFFLSVGGTESIFPILLFSAAAFAAAIIIVSLFKKEALQNEK